VEGERVAEGIRNRVRGSTFIVRTCGQIPFDDFLSADLASTCGYSDVIISGDETTRGIQTKTGAELSIPTDGGCKPPQLTDLY